MFKASMVEMPLRCLLPEIPKKEDEKSTGIHLHKALSSPAMSDDCLLQPLTPWPCAEGGHGSVGVKFQSLAKEANRAKRSTVPKGH